MPIFNLSVPMKVTAIIVWNYDTVNSVYCCLILSCVLRIFLAKALELGVYYILAF